MASNKQRRRPISISTVNYDMDDMEPLPRVDYTQRYNYEETTSSNSEEKKTRSCLITLIIILIIIALLSIAAVIIAIYSLVLITNKTQTVTTTLSTTTSSTTTIATSTGLLCTPFPTTSYQYSTVAPSQCFNYTNNTDVTRNVAYTQSINYCDDVSPFDNTTSIWIRFLDPAGTLVINAPVSPNHCGTVATGWYAGQYPQAFYTTATSIACFYYTTNTCASCSLISVTNCGTFFVFLLPEPDFCNYRYCTL